MENKTPQPCAQACFLEEKPGSVKQGVVERVIDGFLTMLVKSLELLNIDINA